MKENSDNANDEKSLVVSADTLKVVGTTTDSRKEYYKNLMSDSDKYKDLKLSEDEAAEVGKVYRRYSTGLAAAVPLKCTGDACPFADTCPYWKVGRVIIGEECKFEYDLINFYTRKYMEEFDVNPDDFSEVMLISELVELNVYEIRASKTLAQPGNATMTQTVTVMTAAGDETEEERIHNAWVIKEKIKTRRMKILEALAATRREKLKFLSSRDKDRDGEQAKTIADLKKKIDSLMKINDTSISSAADDAVFEEE